jgi:hypothetical protein
VVNDSGIGLVEALRQVGLSNRQTDSIADTLAQGTCCSPECAGKRMSVCRAGFVLMMYKFRIELAI